MGSFGGAQRSDSELLAAHVAGDRYAFEELFHRHHRQLYRLAHITSRNPEDAADALQDAMLSAHRSAAAFRYDSAVSSWLYRIVVNACLDRLRRSKNNPTAVLHEDAGHVADPTPRVDTAIVIERALMRLPVEQRAAVVAVDMQGYSVAETARMLGVAEGTVKSRCSRARTKLAEALDYFDRPPQAGGAPSASDATDGPRSVTMEPGRRWHRPITHGGDRLASERQHTGGGNDERRRGRRRIAGHADHA